MSHASLRKKRNKKKTLFKDIIKKLNKKKVKRTKVAIMRNKVTTVRRKFTCCIKGTQLREKSVSEIQKNLAQGLMGYSVYKHTVLSM